MNFKDNIDTNFAFELLEYSMGFTGLLRKIAIGSSESQSLCLVEKSEEEERVVGITPELETVSVLHNGEKVVIQRDQNTQAKIPSLFSKTSRPCPPFCVQPMSVAPNVETIAELELLDYLQQAMEGSVVVVDSRLKNWVDKGTIPGSVHIPWTSLVASEGATLKSKLNTLMNHFSVKLLSGKNAGDVSEAIANNNQSEVFDYSSAKTLVLFCNGSWCGQTSESIKALLELGYPAEKIKYYRDGMQGWVTLGFTISLNETCDVKKPSCDRL